MTFKQVSLSLFQLYHLSLWNGLISSKTLSCCQAQPTWSFECTPSQKMHSSASTSICEEGPPQHQPTLRWFVGPQLTSKDELITSNLCFSFDHQLASFHLLKNSNLCKSSKVLQIFYSSMKIKLYCTWQGKKNQLIAVSMCYLTVTGITDVLQVNGINRNGKLSLKYVLKLSPAISD